MLSFTHTYTVRLHEGAHFLNSKKEPMCASWLLDKVSQTCTKHPFSGLI
uniref:Uncharacterized protein n=1 Tax=Rhizophora mucronata TaxID=61149 RepID=A0A2P2QCU8_RHIMU